ncbi:hypothetical protein CBS101457_003015 [Exobasidium rhododendri]|nr:hypothetical protein CBS101457_003015 [Exobasidium rhododendri]
MSDDIQNQIIHIINKEVCVSKQSIQKKMVNYLNPLLAIGLLSGDKEEVERSLAALYGASYRDASGEWKKNLNEDQAETLVRLMMNASGRNAVDVRTFFRSKRVTAATAASLLSATDQERLKYAEENKLKRPGAMNRHVIIDPNDPDYLPWMEGTSLEHRRQIIETVKKVCSISDQWARILLNKETKVDHFGLRIIQMLAETNSAEETRLYIYETTNTIPR